MRVTDEDPSYKTVLLSKMLALYGRAGDACWCHVTYCIVRFRREGNLI